LRPFQSPCGCRVDIPAWIGADAVANQPNRGPQDSELG
jgi:hypothetical protein